MSEVVIEKKTFKPAVGMTSLVGVMSRDFPLSFGNYCSIAGGPYLVNFWAENLKEWGRRNPEVAEIEVTMVTHNGRSIGFISDERMLSWCNTRLCITGIGWPSAKVCRLVCDLLGFSASEWLCGCETDDEQPSIFSKQRSGEPEVKTCQRCKRSWERTRESA